MIHPQSGATAWCGGVGMGLMFGGAESFVGSCASSYERQGYVPVEKLTPEQRADLERRGLLPKEEPPPPPTMY